MSDKEKYKEYQKQWYLDNKEKIKQYQLDNKEKIKEKRKQYQLDNKEKRKEITKKYRLNNKEKLNQWYLDNKEKIKEYNKQWRLNNKEKLNKYYLNNKGKYKDKINKRSNKRKQTDQLFKLSCNLRCRILQSIKANGWNKNNTTASILGCNFETVKKHLENQFILGMSWENHGRWHIDHIKPLAKAETEEELYKRCHYTNLQPLWAADNLSKGAKEL